MTGFEDENDLAACLREVLAPKFKDVYAKVNLASRKFYDDWEKFTQLTEHALSCIDSRRLTM